MADKIQAGMILIEGKTFLADSMLFESEQFLDGWRLVKDLDRHSLERKIRAAGWDISSCGSEVKMSVLGFDAEKTIRRALKQILEDLESEQVNCVEITEVGLDHRMGLSCVSVSARPRHIQEDPVLSQSELPAV